MWPATESAFQNVAWRFFPEINHGVNKDRYCILIWEHYIQNLLFQSTPVVAIIQRIRTFGGNLHPNLCQPQVEFICFAGNDDGCRCNRQSRLAACKPTGPFLSPVPCGESWCQRLHSGQNSHGAQRVWSGWECPGAAVLTCRDENS